MCESRLSAGIHGVYVVKQPRKLRRVEARTKNIPDVIAIFRFLEVRFAAVLVNDRNSGIIKFLNILLQVI